MDRFLKKMIFAIPSIKKRFDKVSNERLGYKTYIIDQLDKMHEDIVMSLWNPNHVRKQWVCLRPFITATVEATGDVCLCCNNWLKQTNHGSFYAGNIFTDSIDKIWNSDNAKKLRYSVSQGNFEYCNGTCVHLQDPHKTPEIMIPREKFKPNFNSWQDCQQNILPARLEVKIDSTCNLHCIMCRNNVINNADKNEKINYILENFVRPNLKDCKILNFDGNGEFLASKPYLRFLKSISKQQFPSLILALRTNGQLFTPKKWNELFNLKGMDIYLEVSIDAASKDVYEKIRRGGKWETISRNMEYISTLRTSGSIKNLKLNYVMLKNNFHQMEKYIDLARKWHADYVHFLRLFSCGTFSPEEFSAQDVFSLNNPLRLEAIKIIKKILNETSDILITVEGLADLT